MNKKSTICPICGSNQIERITAESFGQLTLGPEFVFNEVLFKCGSCHEEGDFFYETDKNYLAEQKNAQVSFVKNTIDELSSKGITMAFFERAFELPIRTLTRWKNGDFSSTALALLRIVKTYNWIAMVAEHRFEPSFAIKTALNALEQTRLITENENLYPGAESDSATSSYTVKFDEPNNSSFMRIKYGNQASGAR